jgi:hypothetical protein
MKRLFTLLTLSLFPTTILLATELIINLRGFEIGQYREVVKRELGLPIKTDKYDDGFEYEIYKVTPDTSVYMIFEYAPGNLEIIWSIQLTGKTYQTDFKKLKLGTDRLSIIETLGEPSRKKDIGAYGEKWEYDNTNYSVEINKGGKLSSIKVTDESYRMFPKVDVGKIPTFEKVTNILKSKSNNQIKELLSPDMEIYAGDSVYFFRNNIGDEIAQDKSGVFRLIRELSRTLEKVNTKNIDEYEENVRLNPGQDPMHVIKIKNGQTIKEIVFKYRFGKYLIWEIKA